MVNFIYKLIILILLFSQVKKLGKNKLGKDYLFLFSHESLYYDFSRGKIAFIILKHKSLISTIILYLLYS